MLWPAPSMFHRGLTVDEKAAVPASGAGRLDKAPGPVRVPAGLALSSSINVDIHFLLLVVPLLATTTVTGRPSLAAPPGSGDEQPQKISPETTPLYGQGHGAHSRLSSHGSSPSETLVHPPVPRGRPWTERRRRQLAIAVGEPAASTREFPWCEGRHLAACFP